MRVRSFIKKGAEKILSALRVQKSLHNYKYCTSVHIKPDVPSVLKRSKNHSETVKSIVKTY